MSHTATYTVTDKVEVESMEVSCDGGTPALGHPKVYLHLDPDSHDVTCPYCSRTFVLKAGAHVGGH